PRIACRVGARSTETQQRRKSGFAAQSPRSRFNLAAGGQGAIDMTRFIVAVMLAIAVWPGFAMSQVGPVGGAPSPSPLSMTSPLGIGAPAPVAPAGIPLGATEIVSAGISPGTTPTGLAMSGTAVCSGFGSSIPQASFGAPATGTATNMGSSSSSLTGPGIFDG